MGEFVTAHSCKVADVVTRAVITAAKNAVLGEITARLEKDLIKRVPIVKDGKIVCIAGRANLLQAFACASKKIEFASGADDGNIRKSVIARLTAQRWAGLWPLNVIVQDSAVELWGPIDSAAGKTAIRVMAEETEGVRAVTDNIIVRPFIFGGH
ncbi:BON domain-containing protein [Roseiarcaceae bacterium H3SJ34-1]|uniref:BON domain-containing protein n=1 Tax=Terripilifer ovatus TaxID=3032367 RepID=UPI003AB99F48|nr:BON domain-containing protein [Roseiarcaceae bacterium H3SJ34-1]